MCFVLYAGTSTPMQHVKWSEESPDVAVEALAESESQVPMHFSKPHVQYIASTSGCGCDFPYLMFANGGWPWFDDRQYYPELEASDRYNRETLVRILQATGEHAIELYGLWATDLLTPPAVREEINATTILRPEFRFKERGFYVVRLD